MAVRGTLLITGASGFLGAHCAQRLRGEWDVVAAVHHAPLPMTGVQFVSMDLTQPDSIHSVLGAVRPDAVLHTAAITKPEACDRQPNLATLVNVHATKALAECCSRLGARLVYLSTDLVFDGTCAPYTETAVPVPLSHYGRTKLLGEQAVSALGLLGCTLRTSILYGWPRGPHACFLGWLLGAIRRAPEHGPVRLFTDQFRAFLYIDDAVEMIRRVLAQPIMPPLLHLAGPERASRYAFGEVLCDVFEWPPEAIAEGSMRELLNFSARPADCSMSGDLFDRRYLFRARDIAAGVRALAQSASS